MTKHYCDRCGRLMSKDYTFEYSVVCNAKPLDDLCPTCCKSLQDWVKSAKQTNEKENKNGKIQ